MSDGINNVVPTERAGDADREAVAERLRDAAGDGRLDFAELETRLDLVYAAKTLPELADVIADLPARPHATTVPAKTTPLSVTLQSGAISKKGFWRVPEQITLECMSGSIKLDFTEAECVHREVKLDVTVHSGSVVLVVPTGWEVDLSQASASSGAISNKVRNRPDPGAPVIRVAGTVRSGVIRARNKRRSFSAWLAGRA